MITSRLDHLVVAARSLEQGAAWCEATLGVTPGPGGQHPLMGTHNRLLRIATDRFPRAYLEIIAIDPHAPRPAHPRWFGLDEPALQSQLEAGPRLVHMVCSTDQGDAARAALAAFDLDPGPLKDAERRTSRGMLRWRISLRPDGRRLCDGLVPTLIEWGAAHATDGMPASGITLASLEARHPRAAVLGEAWRAIGLEQVHVAHGEPNLIAHLHTPRGPVTLASGGA